MAPARWPSAFGSAPVRPPSCCRRQPERRHRVLVADELHGRPVPVPVVTGDAHASFRTGESRDHRDRGTDHPILT